MAWMLLGLVGLLIFKIKLREKKTKIYHPEKDEWKAYIKYIRRKGNE